MNGDRQVLANRADVLRRPLFPEQSYIDLGSIR